MIEAGLAKDDGEKTVTTADYIAIGVRCGLSIRETLLCPRGLLLDLWEIYCRANGVGKKKAKNPMQKMLQKIKGKG